MGYVSLLHPIFVIAWKQVILGIQLEIQSTFSIFFRPIIFRSHIMGEENHKSVLRFFCLKILTSIHFITPFS